MKTISFVIPCYASEGSVALVMEEIRQTVAEKPEFDYEIVAVNDCPRITCCLSCGRRRKPTPR